MQVHAVMQDVRVRLLPLGVPVLLPEEREKPLAGRRPGQPGGLQAYLANHPGGYVQLYDPSGLISNQLTDTGFMRLEVIARTRDAAETLAARARALLGGLPTRPTPYRVYIPPETVTQDNLVRITTTYQTRSIGI